MIYTIKESEIIEYVYDIYGSKFLDILELLKNHCEQNGIPLLNNCNKECPGDFVEIIYQSFGTHSEFKFFYSGRGCMFYS